MTILDPFGRTTLNSSVVATDTLITAPTIEPLDLEEVKKALRFSPTSEDTLLDLWISAARQYFEEETGRQLMAATWEYQLDGYPVSVIELPHPPLLEVVSIEHDDASASPPETTVNVDAYRVDASAGPYAARGRILPISGSSWPTITSDLNAVRIRYRAGYGTAPGDVPELVKAALYMLVGHFHKFRAETYESVRGSIDQIPMGAQIIMRKFKYSALPIYPLRRSVPATWV